MNAAKWLFEGKKNSIALEYNGESVTYSQLKKIVDKFANFLIEKKLKGEKIAILADNSFFFVYSYLGCIAAGCVAVPLDNSIALKIIELVKPGAVFAMKKYLPSLENVKIQIFTEEILKSESYKNKVETENLSSENEISDETAVIIFTSGSTGTPKGVMLTHSNIIHNTKSIIQYLKLTENDSFLLTLPLTYCYGASWLHTHLKVGGKMVLEKNFIFPEKTLNSLIENKCTGFGGVPSTYQILLRKSNFKSYTFPHLRYMAQAGGKLPNACLKEIIETFPNIEFYVMYGQTEATARLSYIPPDKLKPKLGSIGKGIPGTFLDVFDDYGKSASTDQVGEVVARGKNIMKGYYNDTEETSKVLKNGYLYTGDLGKKDSEGYIYLVARKKEIIKSAGYRISPKEIEEVIMEMDSIVEAGVIGVEDQLLGEVPKAFVVSNDENIFVKNILSHCKSKLPPYKIPKEIVLVNELPKNSYGKITVESLKRIIK